ncbi:MAG: cyclic nucleotide-binding domain-containing protein [Spirochaetes bacterium]|nr:cyclic nucleotide-binding domain-containing protein [Spirochaetota bacterium]
MLVEVKKYCSGAVIYLEGKFPQKKFYIVKTGKVKIFKKNPIIGDREETRGSGYIFGIIQCITGISEDERAETSTDCEIITIDGDRLGELYKEHPAIIMKILSEYSDILRDLDDDLMQINSYDVFFDRTESVLSMADQYAKLNQLKKAAHLLHSYLKEEQHNEKVVQQVQDKLKKLPKVELVDTTDIMQVFPYERGSVIFTELEKARNFFLIRRGKVKITKLKNNKEVVLAILGEGKVFGEMSILNDKPRMATAVADEACDIMVIDKKGINSLPPPLFVTILKFLTDRIWFVQQQIIAFKLPNPTARLYYFLTARIKQTIRNLKHEMDKSYTFQYPLNELYSMTDLSKEERDNQIHEFLNDHNFVFTYDSIKVKKIGELLDRNSYFYSRALLELKIHNRS